MTLSRREKNVLKCGLLSCACRKSLKVMEVLISLLRAQHWSNKEFPSRKKKMKFWLSDKFIVCFGFCTWAQEEEKKRRNRRRRRKKKRNQKKETDTQSGKQNHLVKQQKITGKKCGKTDETSTQLGVCECVFRQGIERATEHELPMLSKHIEPSFVILKYFAICYRFVYTIHSNEDKIHTIYHDLLVIV